MRFIIEMNHILRNQMGYIQICCCHLAIEGFIARHLKSQLLELLSRLEKLFQLPLFKHNFFGNIVHFLYALVNSLQNSAAS